MASSSKDRVYAAAEKVSEERPPTVTAVREAAGVSMADASRYLKEWKSDHEAAIRQVIAAPPAIVEQGQKLAAAIWAEAVRLAGEQHAAVQAKWEEDTAALTKEVEELVAAADAMEVAHHREVEEAAQSLTQAQSEAATAAEAAEVARHDAAAVHTQNAELGAKLAAAQATAQTLQKSMEAVLARISVPTKTRSNPAVDPGDKS